MPFFVSLTECVTTGHRNLKGFYTEVIEAEKDGGNHISKKDFQGAFISQARRCRFSQFVDAMTNHFVTRKGRNPAEQFIWVDVFTCNQVSKFGCFLLVFIDGPCR